jgi:phosphoglycerol transferase
MTAPTTSLPGNERRAHLAFGAALLAVFVYLVLRNRGQLPMVFADEWLYSQFARLRPLAESTLPSYLYLKLFGATSACGAAFLGCARAGNAALFLLAAPFIYLVARPLAGRNAAMAVALASMLAAVNSYTAYFMPESMYFLCFWVLSWAVLAEIGGIGLAGGLLTGVLLGAMSLVKVHALFLLPALFVYALWRGWRDGRPGAGLLCALALAAAMLAVKFALGWLLAGPAGLDLLGSFYGSHASNKGTGMLERLLAPALWNLHGHAMALMVLFALPLLAFAAAAVSPAARAAAGRPGRSALVYTVLTLGATLGMTVAYTASIADAGPLEGVRLHLRYYDFVFPLLAIAAASPLLAAPLKAATRLALALAAAALLVYATLKLLPTYQLSYVDSPELASATADPRYFHLLAGLQLAAIALWCWRPKLGRAAFLWLLLPAFALRAEVTTHARLNEAAVADAYDRAGVAAQQLSAPQRDAMLMLGDEGAGLPRALFHVDRAATQIMPVAPGTPVDASLLPRDIGHLMVIGKHPLPPELAPQVVTNDYTLTQLPPSRVVQRVMFSEPARDVTLTGFDGLAEREPWGSWSNGKQVTLRFTRPLPRNMTVFLNAGAFGPNAGQQFQLKVGNEVRNFILPGALSERTFRLASDGRQTELSIVVPQPVSPQQLGMGGDVRELGMALIYLEVGEVAPSNNATQQ